MSSLERDSYVKGRRLRDLSQAVQLLALTELEDNPLAEKVGARVLGVAQSVATIFKARQIPKSELKPGISDFIPRPEGVGYKPIWLGLDEIVNRVKSSSMSEQNNKLSKLLASRNYRITTLSDNLTDFIRTESVEDTVDLFFAPSPVYDYYNERRESNNLSVRSAGQRLLGTVALCSYANRVDFKCIIDSLTDYTI